MSEKHPDKLTAVQTLGMIPKGELVTFPSGGQVKQVTVNFTSGKRLRLSEGMFGFVDACSLRPGDVISFEFSNLFEGTFTINKDQPNEKKIQYSEFQGVNGKLTIVEIGAFSDKPADKLTSAGRTSIEFTERIIPAKEAPVAPPKKDEGAAGAATEGTKVGDEGSPFEEEH